MEQEEMRRLWGIIVILSVIAFFSSTQVQSIYALPQELRIMQDEAMRFHVDYPFTVTVNPEDTKTFPSSGWNEFETLSKPVFSEAVQTGRHLVEFKFMGLVPMKQVEVDILPSVEVSPGGQSIGVILHAEGVMVVGSSPIEQENGVLLNPAKEAGIEIGDRILSANGEALESDDRFAEIIHSCGREEKPLQLIVKRGDKQWEACLSPVLCRQTNRYRIGLFVRDSAVGVGTLTFYDNESGSYGALGHVIADSDTNRPVECDRGKIVTAMVSGIQSGKSGQPGEKIGTFLEDDPGIGSIEKNSSFGIYGKLSNETKAAFLSQPVRVASMNQIQTGPAEILTVVDGQTVERFTIEIEKIHLQNQPDGKGMVVKVTDAGLLARTGGIVQGMSGSPILQNGKLVGAVTHVFVHDPTRGYACFMDWMLMESGIIPQKQTTDLPELFGEKSDWIA